MKFRVGTLVELLRLSEQRTYIYNIYRKSSLSYSAVCKDMTTLEKEGLVTKEINLDGRRKWVTLTEKGGKVLEGLRCLYEE